MVHVLYKQNFWALYCTVKNLMFLSSYRMLTMRRRKRRRRGMKKIWLMISLNRGTERFGQEIIWGDYFSFGIENNSSIEYSFLFSSVVYSDNETTDSGCGLDSENKATLERVRINTREDYIKVSAQRKKEELSHLDGASLTSPLSARRETSPDPSRRRIGWWKNWETCIDRRATGAVTTPSNW